MTEQHPADLRRANDVCALASHLSRLGHVVSSQLRLVGGARGWGGYGGGGGGHSSTATQRPLKACSGSPAR